MAPRAAVWVSRSALAEVRRWREHHTKDGAAAQVALQFDPAAHRRDDPVADGQPQPGALADRLGSEEGVENALPERLGNAAARVLHVDGGVAVLQGLGDHADPIVRSAPV